MKHLNISDDAMKIILENSAWQQFGVNVNEAKQKIDESAEQAEEEAVEEHVCPLCQSHLQEAISDEALMEHTANVLEAVNAATLNESEDDDDEDVEDLYEEDDEYDEDEDEDEEELVEEEKPVKKKPRPKSMMPSLDDYIAKHGEEVGREMYKLHGGKSKKSQ